MENKKNVKIVYQYDGSKFYGFQRQENKKTVQGEIEKVIQNSFNEKINLISSGRTDKGVHAIGQVSNFYISQNIPVEAIKKQINKNLGKEIKITNIEEVNKEFNARFDAKKRTYLYVIKKDEKISPFESNYVTSINKNIDVKKLEKIMKIYEGKHDFSSFMKKDKAQRNVVREIYNINCEYDENLERVNIKIVGSSFLKTMVRIMIGSALAVLFEKVDKEYIKNKLENPDENTKKILAPSEGLYLYEVQY